MGVYLLYPVFMDDLWAFLTSVKHAEFEACEAEKTLFGKAEVSVYKEARDVVCFDERGLWSPGNRSFYNTYRWKREASGAIHLYRKRFEGDGWTLLACFVQDNKGLWVSREPHLCGEDCYQASLEKDGANLVLKWTIRGPKKSITVEVRYSSA
tara:strand:+ start:41 stop:499 length:459 start_codon:yes stop_codon:yes gene_type:complete